MNSISTIAKDDMLATWPGIGPLLFANQVKHGRTVEEAVHDVAIICSGLVDGSMKAWIVKDDGCDYAKAMCVTMTEGDAVRVFGMVGQNVRSWARDLSDKIAKFAADHGFKSVRYTGRPEWTRLLPEFKPAQWDESGTTFERMV